MSAGTGVELLTSGQVAGLFRVDAKTVSKWAKAGWLLTTETLGGHYRFFAVEVAALLRGETPEKARELAEAERARLAGGTA